MPCVHTLSGLAATGGCCHTPSIGFTVAQDDPKPLPARVRNSAKLIARRHDRDQGSPGRAARPTRIFCRWKAAANWHRLGNVWRQPTGHSLPRALEGSSASSHAPSAYRHCIRGGTHPPKVRIGLAQQVVGADGRSGQLRWQARRRSAYVSPCLPFCASPCLLPSTRCAATAA